MKWVVYALLLANLAVGLWHYRLIGAEQPVASAQVDENLRLVLLKEYLAQTASQSSQDQKRDAEPSARCYTLGPFKSTEDAQAAADELGTQGIPAKRRLSRDNSRRGFWVLLPPAANRQIAKESIKELKARGIKDYFLVVTGEQNNAVSLGVFSQPELAQRRYEDIKALGFDAKVQTVDLPLREYWLDWPLEKQLSPDVLEQLTKQYSGIGQVERNCTAN